MHVWFWRPNRWWSCVKKGPFNQTVAVRVRQIEHFKHFILKNKHQSYCWAWNTSDICLFFIESNHGINGPNGMKWISFTNITSILIDIILVAENSIICCMDSIQNVNNALTRSFWSSSLFERVATIRRYYTGWLQNVLKASFRLFIYETKLTF